MEALRAGRVTLLYHLRPINLPGAQARACDLTDFPATMACLDQVRPSVIVHCAAVTDVDQCEVDLAAADRLNVGATELLSDWARSRGAFLVYISTDAVFDGRRGHYSEQDAPAPVNHYAQTKLRAEKAVRRRLPQSSLVVRTTLHGWSHSGRLSFSEWILRGLLLGEQRTLFSDVRFSPLLANDLARLVLELVARRASGTYHLGARDSCSKYEFGLCLARVFGLPSDSLVPISADEFPFKTRRPKDISLVVDKVSALLGRPTPSVEEGLRSWKASLAEGYVERVKGTKPEWLAAVSATSQGGRRSSGDGA